MYGLAAAGKGLIISENCGLLQNMGMGDTVEIPSPSGLLRLPVVGIVTDYLNQSGSMFVDYSAVYLPNWKDPTVDMYKVYVKQGASAEEMKQQIPRMGNIYSAAEEVLVWLGHEQRGEAAMELVRDWPGPVNWLHVDVNNKEELERANLVQSMRNEVAEAAVYLLLLPYWSRVWIVQEVVLARKVRVKCGNISLDLDDFRSKVDPFRHETTELNYQPTVWSLCELREKGGKKPLWELTRDFDLCMSTRTIDKVYGFFGLVADHEAFSQTRFAVSVVKSNDSRSKKATYAPLLDG